MSRTLTIGYQTYAQVTSRSPRLHGPNAAIDDLVIYHMPGVTSGREPMVLDLEHNELRWFMLIEALALPDLPLAEYTPLLAPRFDVALSKDRR